MLRVLHGPVNVGNHPWVLSRQERLLDARSELVVNYSTWLKYNADECLGEYGVKTFRTVSKRFWFGLRAPFRYDVLHYYFGRTFWCWDDWGQPTRLWFRDLRLARSMGRKIFMTLQGCDARLAGCSDRRYQTTMCREGRCTAYATCRQLLDRRRVELIENILPLCDKTFILNPELSHYVPGATFLPFANVDVERFEPIPPRKDGPIRIVHAPSDPNIKGTSYIEAAVQRLKTRYPIEFVLVQGLTHAEAMKLYRSADLVIDQVLAGWYGGLAVEVMAMGKPVICYIRDEDLSVIPDRMREELPILNATIENLESRLVEIIESRNQWGRWSQQAREFVLRWHNPRRIAQAMLDAYDSPDSRFSLAERVEARKRCAA